MRIGVMLRHLTDTMGGVVGYSHNLINAFLRQGPDHHYVLLYAQQEMLGTYAQHANVSEVVLGAGNKFCIDQWQVPRAASRLGLDLIFNPKLSVPLWGAGKKVFVLRPEQFVHPEFFQPLDRQYFKLFIPRYCAASAKVIAPTHQATADIIKYVGVKPGKMVTVHEACGDRFFAPAAPDAQLERVRKKYKLPESYVLFVGGLTPLKNFRRLVKAFALVHAQQPVPLVVVGFNRHKFKNDLAFAAASPVAQHIHFPGYVDDDDLPSVYRLASALFFPSVYEGFGIPICEGFATGCPVVTTNKGCCPEVAGDAAELVDPLDVADMARGLLKVLSDDGYRAELIARGKKRAPHFTFDRCGRQTLDVFESVVE